MRDRLFVSEVVCVTFHGDAEPLCENVVPCSGVLLGTLNFVLIGFVGNRLADVRSGLHPHVRLADFLDVIETVVEDRCVRSFVLTLQDRHQFHFDGIADSVTNSSF